MISYSVNGTDYSTFLASKTVRAVPRGIVDPPDLPPHLFAYQAECVRFGARAGSWGLYLDTGLGKTACELEWSRIAAAESNGRALILAPLAVARQIEAEGKRWGYQIRVIRDQSGAGDGINVCNYDRLEKLDPAAFGSVVLDEASILKSFTGATQRALTAAFAGHRWRMAATATPAPNDHMELGQQAEFLGIMPSNEMLMRWFIADQTQMGTYRLKGHASRDFWDWMASWSRMAEHPRDLGDDRPGFDLPPLRVHRHRVDAEVVVEGSLFVAQEISATDMHKIKKQTAGVRAERVGELVSASREPWVVWCDTNYEADALLAALGPEACDVRGSMTTDEKESRLAAFASGEARVIVTKPSICGFGLNWQHCARMAFVGRTFSYESWYQAVRRCWRFGQAREVECHLIVAEGEDSIGRVIDRKGDDHIAMKKAMTAAMLRNVNRTEAVRHQYVPTHEGRLPSWFAV